jgi:hypothetical protein
MKLFCAAPASFFSMAWSWQLGSAKATGRQTSIAAAVKIDLFI